jgi:large subunit ribosomal protein L22
MQKNNTVKAINKNVRSSQRKISLVLDHIRGKKVGIVLKDLEFIRKKISLDISKTVKSALANAENNKQYDIDNLFIKEAYVGKSLVMKRFRPRAKGRAAPILKPYSSVTIILSEMKKMESHGTKS